MDVAIVMIKTDEIYSLKFGLTWFILVVIHVLGLSKPLPDRSMRRSVETASEREHEILLWTAFDLDNAILHSLAG